eukprot:scaffold14366_cov27-Tisochrysis_lutea.AAC.2
MGGSARGGPSPTRPVADATHRRRDLNSDTATALRTCDHARRVPTRDIRCVPRFIVETSPCAHTGGDAG